MSTATSASGRRSRVSSVVAFIAAVLLVAAAGLDLAAGQSSSVLPRRAIAGGSDKPLPKGPVVSVNVDYATQGVDLRAYTPKLIDAVYRSWLREVYAEVQKGEFGREQRQKGLSTLAAEVVLQVVVERAGRVSSATVTKPSVLEVFDRLTLQAVQKARIPALPAEVPGDRETVTLRVGLGKHFEDDIVLKLRLEKANLAHEF